MIGIYEDSFVEFLKDKLGDPVDVKIKNIVCRCPWCEYNKQKSHYHLWISTEVPIFHCFFSDCGVSGTISKLVRKIVGRDESDRFVDKEKIKSSTKEFGLNKTRIQDYQPLILPDLKENMFHLKSMYLRKRLYFHNIQLSSIKNLIFDINEFFSINSITPPENVRRIKDFLHSNFIGFLSEHHSVLVMRNIDEGSSFRYFKFKIRESPLLDYYKLNGNNKDSNMVVLSEGIFDIFSEHIFDKLELKSSAKLYASTLSSASFPSLLKSLSFYEQVYRSNVVVLSDKDVTLDYYKNMKKYNNHLIDKLTIFYNKTGKDFNNLPIIPEKFIIS